MQDSPAHGEAQGLPSRTVHDISNKGTTRCQLPGCVDWPSCPTNPTHPQAPTPPLPAHLAPTAASSWAMSTPLEDAPTSNTVPNIQQMTQFRSC